ncbi:transglutaminase-like domain-containing protein [Jeotgalibaca ciconiae]|uniref:Transglutaminase domain-containing protein n=1 Tax=Jeotgalibaca ciconiae TaxID=2496265 RepID=A0A3S9HC94_9LACT|nr:transglutaminase-like domain-containing protein [Jeotgalibaca ciconiae]AZP05002.1 transglutaminase domain-containing protein [Jeotgalibaca ciconiae]
MIKKKEFWISFLKKAALTVANIYLFYPIIEIFVPLNEFESPLMFHYFLIASSLIALLLPFWFIWLPLQISVILFTFQQYFPLSESGWDWVRTNYTLLSETFSNFMAGGSNIFPTNLALLLMLLFISLATYLLINHRKPSWAILTSLVYLMILHVFTDYDFFAYVVQILGVSLVLLGVTQIPTDKGWRTAAKAFFVASIFGGLITWFSFWSTENLTEQQQWVENNSRKLQKNLDDRGVFDFVDFYRSGEGLQQLGYGEDDRSLGGPVQQNFDPAFVAYSDTSHYWRISTKTTYNGSGWNFADFSYLISIDYLTKSTLPSETSSEIIIERDEDFHYFPYTYQLIDTQIDNGYFAVKIPSLDLEYQNDDEQTMIPTSYTLTIADIGIGESLLRNAPEIEEELLEAEELQVPNSVPLRVWELAAEITEGSNTVYDRVLAIENYLRSEAGLRYSMREASFVPEGEDYVDHFLFESKVGYCDNFSTAMVILARMNGIPARWAKGFNGGTQQTNEEGNTFYEITNANAHSWPEIYFPEVGWVPFEPTPAYQQSLANFVTPDDGTEEETPVADEESLLTADEEDEIVPDAEAESAQVPETRPDTDASHVNDTADTGWPKRFVGILLGMGVIIGVLTHRKWYASVIELFIQNPSFSLRTKTKLVLSLFGIGYKKRKQETLRQYFEEVTKAIPMHKNNILAFVQVIEKLLYAPADEKIVEDAEVRKILLNMVTAFKDLQAIQKKSSF